MRDHILNKLAEADLDLGHLEPIQMSEVKRLNQALSLRETILGVADYVERGIVPPHMDHKSFIDGLSVDATQSAVETKEIVSSAQVYVLPSEILVEASLRSELLLKEMIEEAQKDAGGDLEVSKEIFRARFEALRGIGLPSSRPFEQVFVCTSPFMQFAPDAIDPYLREEEAHQELLNMPHDLPYTRFMGGWGVDFNRGVVYRFVPIRDISNWYSVGVQRVMHEGEWVGQVLGLLALNQCLEVINDLRSKSLIPKPSRLKMRQAVKGIMAKGRKNLPEFFITKMSKGVISEACSRPAVKESKGRMLDYHTDRAAHERVLVQSIASDSSPEDIMKFIDKWLERGYWIFERPSQAFEDRLNMDARAAGPQRHNEIRAIKVVQVSQCKIGNLDARYIPSVKIVPRNS